MFTRDEFGPRYLNLPDTEVFGVSKGMVAFDPAQIQVLETWVASQAANRSAPEGVGPGHDDSMNLRVRSWPTGDVAGRAEFVETEHIRVARLKTLLR
jgi:hypothetical protein